MKRIWKSKNDAESSILEILLQNRGISESSAIEDFLEPKYELTHDPFGLTDMEKAVQRVRQAVERKEQITVYADYDADAVTAAAVVMRFLQKIGHKKLDYYIPDRFSEGYGINAEAIAALEERGTNMIITVDCGINANDAVSQASALGMDVIVTDHHQITGLLPQAAAIINPHRLDDHYPFKDLTGVGVAFKLAQALTRQFSIKPGWEKWLLDLVAIGTVADCQSLLGENRILVKWGLRVLEKTKWIGLRKLLKISGLLDAKLETYQLGFVIAPRLNAAGRIEHANLALELLLTDDEARAEELAAKLNELNTHRQDLTQQILSEAREQLETLSGEKILLAAGEGWPKGVVGLVAGKLTEEYYRPVLILEKSGDHATGSARSIRNFNIVEAIGKSESILVKYGGHPMAAGFTIKSEHIEVFYKNLREYAENILTSDDLSPILEYETRIELPQVTEELVELLEKFSPFGLGNPRPKFRIDNLVPRSISQIGRDGKHLRINTENFGCVGFNLGFWAEKLQHGQAIDVICEPQWNEWNGSRKIQLKIIDLQQSQEGAA